MRSKILFKMEKYIGKKVNGFKFESGIVSYGKTMHFYVGRLGVIKSYISEKSAFSVKFHDGSTWYYPADEDLNHLVKEFVPTYCDGTPVEVKPSVTIVSKIPSVESLLSGAKPNVNQVPIETPTHYQTNEGFDVIDIAEAYNLNFNRGSAVKYICRAGKKENEIEDLKKAINCLNRELKKLEK